jgi:hypothetical protein
MCKSATCRQPRDGSVSAKGPLTTSTRGGFMSSGAACEEACGDADRAEKPKNSKVCNTRDRVAGWCGLSSSAGCDGSRS